MPKQIRIESLDVLKAMRQVKEREVMSEYLLEHNEREHNYHTDLEESGFDVCIECDLIRRTGGLYEWKEEELVTDKEYAEGRANA